MRTDSVQAWREHFYNLPFEWKVKGIDGETYKSSDWIFGKEVRITKLPGVNESAISYVTKGIQDIIRNIGLDFHVIYLGEDDTTNEQVKQATDEDGRIDGEKLSKILVAEDWRKPGWQGKEYARPHADVIVTDQYIKLGDDNWGQSEFSKGYMILSLVRKDHENKNRQISYDFIRKITKHEAGHLFGFAEHHDRDEKNIPGYLPFDKCNMLWKAPDLGICYRCLDALIYFWKGIENKTGKKFFRD